MDVVWLLVYVVIKGGILAVTLLVWFFWSTDPPLEGRRQLLPLFRCPNREAVMGIKYAELDSMSDEELIEKHDHELGRRQVQTPTDLWLEELHRRNMRRHTKAITFLTVVITVATVVNVGIVAGFW